jgi:glycerate 2-kinase
MNNHPSRTLLAGLWRAAVAAVSVNENFAARLPPPASRHTAVIAAGKAAAAMAAAAFHRYGDAVCGLAVTRHGHGLRAGENCGAIRMIEAGHPLPDQAGLAAGAEALKLADGLATGDLLLCLLSGGGSALLEAPLPGISHSDLKAVNDALLRCGAPIDEMNAVRKHLSRIKGGRLAAAAYPAKIFTLAISDVPGDDPAVIASGPTVADPSTAREALDIIARYAIAAPQSVRRILRDGQFETPKPGDPRLKKCEYQLAATSNDALIAAAREAERAGFAVVNRGAIEGEAREVALKEARLATALAEAGKRAVILAGGELTVTLSGDGTGGANREYALALALALNGHPAISALAADTDGIDGSSDAAGAYVFPDTLARARAANLDAAILLEAHDSGGFFAKVGDALITGPTRTNVADFRAIVVGA